MHYQQLGAPKLHLIHDITSFRVAAKTRPAASKQQNKIFLLVLLAITRMTNKQNGPSFHCKFCFLKS